RTYSLTYGANASGRSRLAQVGQTSLPPTTFAYYADPSGAATRFDAPITSSANVSPPADLSLFSLQEGDFNGDGKTDFCLHYRQNGTIYAYVSLSNGDGSFTTPALWQWSDTPPVYWFDQWRINFADINGDGRMDMLLTLPVTVSGSKYLYYYYFLSNGD